MKYLLLLLSFLFLISCADDDKYRCDKKLVRIHNNFIVPVEVWEIHSGDTNVHIVDTAQMLIFYVEGIKTNDCIDIWLRHYLGFNHDNWNKGEFCFNRGNLDVTPACEFSLHIP